MKAAFAHWDGRIAPVFDTAGRVRIIEVQAGRIVGEAHETLPEDAPAQKALRLAGLEIDTLVCGAISRTLYGMITAYGIQVIPFVAGDLGEVVAAWQAGTLEHDAFAMPGCCGRGRRWFGGRNQGFPEEVVVDGRGRGRAMAGGVSGRGRGRWSGFAGATFAVGTSGYCLCPQCGREEPHEPGVPCVEKACPACGTAMVRK